MKRAINTKPEKLKSNLRMKSFYDILAQIICTNVSFFRWRWSPTKIFTFDHRILHLERQRCLGSSKHVRLFVYNYLMFKICSRFRFISTLMNNQRWLRFTSNLKALKGLSLISAKNCKAKMSQSNAEETKEEEFLPGYPTLENYTQVSLLVNRFDCNTWKFEHIGI